MFWANFLHFYQPPTQKKYWIDRVTKEAYGPILRQLEKIPQACLTINIAAVLFELWDKHGYLQVIDGYRSLVKKKQIEVTSSAKYHPLLPKLTKEEITRQIKLNESTLEKYLDIRCPEQTPGFFPPEMAYDRNIAQVVYDLGYKWIIAEELSYKQTFNEVDYSKIYQIQDIGLKIFFRERSFSYKILSGQIGTINLFLQELGDRLHKKEYLLTAMDGETFGHHRPGMERLLFELYKFSEVRPITISEIFEHFQKVEIVSTFPSTWALMEQDVERRAPFSRWDDYDNEIHQKQWELTNLAVRTVQKSKYNIPKLLNFSLELASNNREALLEKNESLNFEEKAWVKARLLLDRALHSDQYWWASARPWWSLEMIERGTKELKDAIFTVPDASEETRQKAQQLYFNIIVTGFDWQRSGKVEEISRKEDEEVRMRTDEGLPKLPKKELEKMIKALEEELKLVVNNQEYERAIQMRDRIQELEEYMKS